MGGKEVMGKPRFPDKQLKIIHKMKTDAKKRSDEFYERANKWRGIDDTNSNLSNINGFLNSHMDMVYGVIEDLTSMR